MTDTDTCYAIYLTDISFRPSLSNQPFVGWVELPSCPRCLMRLDTSITGIVQHQTSHTERLKHRHKTQQHTHDHDSSDSSTVSTSWSSGVACAVCLLLSSASPHTLVCSSVGCSVSGDVRESLWICLLCAHIGCGRYYAGHAYQHYQDTQQQHRYNIELLEHYIWDYHSDGFVHRIQGRDREQQEQDRQQQHYQQTEQHRDRTTVTAEMRYRAGSDDRVSASTQVEENADADLSVDIDDVDDCCYSSSSSDLSDTAAADDDDSESLLLTKLSSVTSHYNQLLTSELLHQSAWFEQRLMERLRMIEDESNEQTATTASQQQALMETKVMIEEWEKRARQTERMKNEKQARNAAIINENEFMKQINNSIIQDQQTARKQQTVTATMTMTATTSPSSSSSSSSALSVKDRRLSSLQQQVDQLMQQLEQTDSKQQKQKQRKE